jgi:hypothetical protein
MTKLDEAKYHEAGSEEGRHDGETRAKTRAHELTGFELELVAGGVVRGCYPCYQFLHGKR